MKKKALWILTSLCIVLSVFIFFNRNHITLKPWQTSVPLMFATGAAGNSERTAIITNSGASVAVVNDADKLLFCIDADENNHKSFSHAKFVDIDSNNNLYILDTIFSAPNLKNTEKVLKYSPNGTFLSEVYRYDYINNDFILTKGKTACMNYIDGNLNLAFLEDNEINIIILPLSGSGERKITLPYEKSHLNIEYVDINGTGSNILITLTTKAGAIKQFNSSCELVFELPPSQDMNLPWNAVSDGNGGIIYTDILSRQIKYIDTTDISHSAMENGGIILYYKEISSAYYTLKLNNKKLFASPSNKNSIIMTVPLPELNAKISLGQEIENPKYIENYTFSDKQIIIHFALFTALFIDALSAAAVLLILVTRLLKRNIPGVIKNIITVIFCMYFGSGLASFLIINEMLTRYNEKSFDALENIALLTAPAVDIDVLLGFNTPSEWESAEYKEFMEGLDRLFSNLKFDEKRLYQVLVVIKDGTMYSMYDTGKSTGIFSPAAEYGAGDFLQLLDKNQFVREDFIATDGAWRSVSYALSRKDGNVNVILETGYNSRDVQKQNKKLVVQVLVYIIAISSIIILIIVFLMIWKTKGRNHDRSTK